MVDPTANHSSDETSSIYHSCKSRSLDMSSPSSSDVDIKKLLRPSLSNGGDQENDQAEQHARRAGVVFRHLTVLAKATAAVEQGTSGDLILSPLRALRRLVSTRWSSKQATQQPRALLDGIDGCIRPREMLLVLGRPGAGCSTFLKVLGNHRDGYAEISGSLTFGGVEGRALSSEESSAVTYNPEDDLHFPTLNVKQTLNFAIQSKTRRSERQDYSSYLRETLDGLVRLFWIQHTLFTKVGNAYVRGISGGERKRVTIAEGLVTKSAVQMWDNSTRGLDSSSALEYIAALRSLTDGAGISTAVALYQAGETLYKYFDKVILLDEGKCLYFGPASEARQYFVDLGFQSPETLTTSDFLISMANPHERRARTGFEDCIPRTPEQFRSRYRESDIRARNLLDMESLETQIQTRDMDSHNAPGKGLKHGRAKTRYAVPFWRQVLICVRRNLQILWGDKASLFGKWGGIVFQSLVIGSLFYDTPSTSSGVFLRGGVIFFLLLFNLALAGSETMAGFEGKPIMLKHKSLAFHRPAALAVAQFLVDIPIILGQILLFEVVIYFLTGLGRTASQFFLSVFCLWLTTLVMYALNRAIAAVFQSQDMAMGFAGTTLQLLILYIGYIIPPQSMHPWFKWITYVNPLQYAFEILIANEFAHRDIPCVPPSLAPYGPGAVPGSQGCGVGGSIIGDTIVSGQAYVHSLGYSYSHVWRNIGILCGFCAFNLLMMVIGMETSRPAMGGASLRLFKRGHLPGSKQDDHSQLTSTDEEKQTSSGQGPISASSAIENPISERTTGVNNAFAFRNINLTVRTSGGPKQLLKSLDGVVGGGRLTALMGSSGAGKTTLLNTLAQRSIKGGKLEGEIRLNGEPLLKSFRRKVGYAEQMDLHEETSTVLEAIRFSALLRQPACIPVTEKYAYCEQVIDMLELHGVAHAVIGTNDRGLNPETRKIVTIAVELAAKPETLFFLDEPTSGLDSAAAFNVVRMLRKLADSGLAILCTIHQPSSNLLGLFDDLLLLGTGGRCVYNGPLGQDCREMIDYFEALGAAECNLGENPAEYMLTTIGAGDPSYRGPDWADKWALSDARKRMSVRLEHAMRSSPPSAQTPTAPLSEDLTYYATSLLTQTLAVLKRAFVAQWRKPEYVYGKIIMHVSCALFNGFSFYKIGYSSLDMQSRMFSIFLVLAVAPPLIQQLLPPFLQSRRIFECRENQSQMYSWLAWVIGAIITELPLSIFAGTLYFVSWWFCSLGFSQNGNAASSYMWLMIQIYELYYISFGQMFAAFVSSEMLASLLSTAFFLFILSFCGAFVPTNAIPSFWRSWMVWIDPYHYILEGMLSVAVHDLPVICKPDEFSRFYPPPGQSCESYTAPFIAEVGGYVQTTAQGLCEMCQYSSGDQYAAGSNIFYHHRWRDAGIALAFVAFNFSIVLLATWLRFEGGRMIAGVTMGRLKPTPSPSHTPDEDDGQSSLSGGPATDSQLAPLDFGDEALFDVEANIARAYF
ncbi:ABC-2 type transporter [Lecanosticta acicola]|uniref:ABC-2 type transporter n=1 Tax=Lecanosticta acicola TaxID=111012 RepID=A0AAI8Z8M0_9PEZI|nr:ABC-2 type transporter [Lecanosticta acicola]